MFARGMFANVDQVEEIMPGKLGAPTSERALEQEATELVAFAQSEDDEVTTNHRWAVGMATQMAFRVAPLLTGRHWRIVHRSNDRTSLVTSDAPVVLSTVQPRNPRFYGIGFGSADAMVILPLTQSCALVILGEDGVLEHRRSSASPALVGAREDAGLQRDAPGQFARQFRDQGRAFIAMQISHVRPGDVGGDDDGGLIRCPGIAGVGSFTLRRPLNSLVVMALAEHQHVRREPGSDQGLGGPSH